MTARLTIIRGPKSGKVFEFDRDEITIGSGRSNDIVLLDNDVHTYHCRLLRVDQDYDIEDLGSRYGTFVNGQQIEANTLLRDGSVIELGGQVAIEYTLPYDTRVKKQTAPLYLVKDDPRSQPCLVRVEEGEIKAAYLLQSASIKVGRSVGNDIIIQASDISREHLNLTWKNGSFFAEDMKSRNGTFVNGVAINSPVQLHPSDVIRLGSLTQLHYVPRSDLPKEWDPIHMNMATPEPNQETTMPHTAWATRSTSTREMGQAMQEGELEDHILVAYAREDWEHIVAPILLNLKDSNQDVWADQHLRPGSEAWVEAVDQAQRECWLLVVVVSPESMESNHVKDCYRYFFNREKPLLVVNYKPVDRLPMQLSRVSQINYDPENPGLMFRQLLFEILHLKPRYAGNNNNRR